jgi:hypothetical protein
LDARIAVQRAATQVDENLVITGSYSLDTAIQEVQKDRQAVLRLKERLSYRRFGKRSSPGRLLLFKARKAYASFEPSTSHKQGNHSFDVVLEKFCCESLVEDN